MIVFQKSELGAPGGGGGAPGGSGGAPGGGGEEDLTEWSGLVSLSVH